MLSICRSTPIPRGTTPICRIVGSLRCADLRYKSRFNWRRNVEDKKEENSEIKLNPEEVKALRNLARKTYNITDMIDVLKIYYLGLDDHILGRIFLEEGQNKNESRRKIAGFNFHVEFPHKAKLHRNLKLLIIADGLYYKVAKNLGVGTVYSSSELSDVVIDSPINYNLVLSTVESYPSVVSKLSRYIGPLGLMPTVREGTVTNDIETAVEFYKTKTILSSKDGVIGFYAGEASWPTKKIADNSLATFNSLVKYIANLPESKRKSTIESVCLMGPHTPALLLEGLNTSVNNDKR